MRLFKKLLIALVIVGIFVSSIIPARAVQQSLEPSKQLSSLGSFQGQSGSGGVKIQARAAFGDDGSFLIGAWFPVRVTLDNPAGGQNMRVRVEVSLLGQGATATGNEVGVYARDVELPSPARKQVTLYAYAVGFIRSMDVRVVQGEAVVAKTTVSLNPLDSTNSAIVGVISSDASLLNIYKGEVVGHPQSPPYSTRYGSNPSPQGNSQAARATISHMSLDDIPALPNSLDGLAALIIDDVDTGTLTQEQRDTLAAWVGRGGTLVVASRPGGPNTLSGLADLSPVTATGTRTLTGLQGLVDFVATPITSTGSIIVPDAKLRAEPAAEARLLAAEGGVPLVAMRDVGEGQVVYLAVSPGMAPVKNWDGVVPLVRRILAEHVLRPAYGQQSSYAPPQGQLFNTYGSIFDLPGLDLPEPLLIGLFMLVYIVIIGPVNYIVLKRLRRSELAWLTIPAAVAVFSVGAYIIGVQSKGGELLAIRGNVMHTEPGLKQAQASQYLGLFSPVRRTYRLELNADATATETNPNGYGGNSSARSAVILGGPTTTLENVNINTWSLRSFVAESAAQVASPLQTDLRLGDNMIEGTVRNSGNSSLQDVALIRGGAVQYIGSLAPGQQAPVRLSISNQTFDPGSPVAVMPLPDGVLDPTANNPNSGYGGRLSNEQRQYNRRVQMLETALTPLLVDTPPTDMSVISVAWGPTPPATFRVLDRTTRTDDMNVWTGHHIVTAGADQSKARLNNGLTPFSLYAPSANPAWAVPNNSSFALNPYSELRYRIPAGTQPRSLTVKYEVGVGLVGKPLDVLGYNVRTGAWDRLIALGTSGVPSKADFSIPTPADYASPDGSVALRFASTASSNIAEVTFSLFDLTLNDEQ